MLGTFCALSYQPRVKLLNNGNIVGLRFGYRAVQTSDHRVAGSKSARGGILTEPRRHFIAQSLSCSPDTHLFLKCRYKELYALV